MGFVYIVTLVLKALWIVLSETINILRKLHKTNIFGIYMCNAYFASIVDMWVNSRYNITALKMWSKAVKSTVFWYYKTKEGIKYIRVNAQLSPVFCVFIHKRHSHLHFFPRVEWGGGGGGGGVIKCSYVICNLILIT